MPTKGTADGDFTFTLTEEQAAGLGLPDGRILVILVEGVAGALFMRSSLGDEVPDGELSKDEWPQYLDFGQPYLWFLPEDDRAPASEYVLSNIKKISLLSCQG
jgi:hypothetical protein